MRVKLLVRHPRVECDLRVTCNLALKGEVAPILDNLANHSVSLTILVVVILGGVCSCFCEGINPRRHGENTQTPHRKALSLTP